MFLRESVLLCALFSALPVFAGEMPFGFSTELRCDEASGRVGFAEGAAILQNGSEASLLHQAPAASGARYESEAGDLVFWIKGDEALFSTDEGEQTCALIPDPSTWTARGNEPGWRIDVEDGKLAATLDYGEITLEKDLPDARLFDGALWYDWPDLSLFLRPSLCRDDMTGMTYPESVTLKYGGKMLRGCAGEALDVLAGPEWRVEDIEGAGIIDASHVTLAISKEARVSGSASCNRYMGALELGPEGLSFGPLAATQMMCPEALMAQEGRYLAALASVDWFEIDETGALVLYASGAPVITASR